METAAPFPASLTFFSVKAEDRLRAGKGRVRLPHGRGAWATQTRTTLTGMRRALDTGQVCRGDTGQR